MESKAGHYKTELLSAIEKEDEERFQQLLKERTAYIHALTDDEIKRSEILLIMKADQELQVLMKKKTDGLKSMLLGQAGQLKAMNKYDHF